jgi:subtilisin family serine protease
LNALGVVEFAEPAPVPSPLPVDIPPVTPNMTGEQGYKFAAPGGVGVLSSRYPGANGTGIEIVDVEYSWQFNHEDLELPASRNIDNTGTLSDPFNDTNHGTAVLGEIVGISNAYGVTGIVPNATALVAPANTVEFGFDPARAIGIATGRLDDGDVILIEQQAPACGGACGANQVGCGPQEAIQSVFDAISAATAKGIVVVEAAGNGNVNLDAPACGNLFNRNVRDSRAIIVGAGTSTAPHTRLSFSSFGSRVDVQAWGQNVTTTGYGDRFNPADVRQRYTSTFGGTSGASPIVTGVVASIQGFRLRCGKAFLTPLQMRTNLVNNGTPQGPGANHIGPLPRILQSIIASGAGRCMVGPGPA